MLVDVRETVLNCDGIIVIIIVIVARIFDENSYFCK